jgi:queuine/archaeosine tRNA-ribosyltransferase
MLRGTVDFVDPDNLIKLYKKDANIGMPLDLPVPSAAEPFFFDAVSKMIRANDRYMEPKLKGIDLALISHGSTLARRKARLDVLDRDDAKVIAIAGLNIKPEPGTDHLMAFCENLMYVIHRFHKTARYFHVLGVTSKFWLFIYALLDASGYVKNIGADSVSHRLGSLTGMYDTQDFNSVYLPKDRKFKQPLPCSCPVCFALDDMRLMQYYVLLEAHNLWTRAHWVKLLSEMAKRYVAGQLPLKEVHEVLRLRMSINDLTLIIKYIESIIETDKFKPIRVQGKSRSLFATQTPKKSPKHDLYIKILQSYEKFHGIKLL